MPYRTVADIAKTLLTQERVSPKREVDNTPVDIPPLEKPVTFLDAKFVSTGSYEIDPMGCRKVNVQADPAPMGGNKQRHFAFLDLPFELQAIIMEFALFEDGPIVVRGLRDGRGKLMQDWQIWKPHPLTRVSIIFREFAQKLYFSLNRDFVVHNDYGVALKFLTKLEPMTYRLIQEHARSITFVFRCDMHSPTNQARQASHIDAVLRANTILKRRPELLKIQPMVSFRPNNLFIMPEAEKKQFSELFEKRLRSIRNLGPSVGIPLTRSVVLFFHDQGHNYRSLRNAFENGAYTEPKDFEIFKGSRAARQKSRPAPHPRKAKSNWPDADNRCEFYWPNADDPDDW